MERDPASIIKQFEMDPLRRTLFVEGARDRILLEWIIGKELDKDTLIQEINSVDIKVKSGGNKGRAMGFASLINDKPLNISFFLDADFDRVLDTTIPPKVILTDNNDLEGYLLKTDCFEKLLKVGMTSEKITAVLILETIFEIGKQIGILRLTSHIKKYDLPFKKVNKNFYRYFRIDNQFNVSFNITNYINVLLQISDNFTLGDFDSINSNYVKYYKKYYHLNPLKLIHGKDAIFILTEICKKLGIKKENIDRMYWMGFNKESILEYPNLCKVINFMRNNTS